jgi:hypothetical protein
MKIPEVCMHDVQAIYNILICLINKDSYIYSPGHLRCLFGSRDIYEWKMAVKNLYVFGSMTTWIERLGPKFVYVWLGDNTVATTRHM